MYQGASIIIIIATIIYLAYTKYKENKISATSGESETEEKPKEQETPSEDKPAPHGDKSKKEEKKSPNIIGWVLTIILGIFVFGFLYWLIFVPSSKEQEKEKNVNITNITGDFLPSKFGGPSLGFIDKKTINPMGPDSVWITPAIENNSEFRFWSKNHDFYVQFLNSKGGWTEKVFIQKDLEKNKILTPDSVPGITRITGGKREKSPFEVKMYMN